MGFAWQFNKFAYPGGWAKPGFDSKHLAAGSGMRASGIAVPGSSAMISLFPGAPPIFGNNSATPVMSTYGPAVQCAGGAGVISRTGPRMTGTFATPNAVTFGIIFYFLGVGQAGGTPVLAAIGNSGTTQQGIGFTIAPTHFSLNFGSSFTALDSGISLVLNDWTFAAASYDHVSTKYSFLTLSIGTGKLQTASGTSTQTLGSSSDGVLYTGGFSSNNTSGANISAVMYAENNFLSVPQLVRWAKAPWDFWYPPIKNTLTVKTPTPVTSTESGTLVNLLRGNKLAYPGGWARPGFRTNHLAAGNGARMSWVATPGSNVGVSLLSGTVPLPTNVTSIATQFGPAINCTNSSGPLNVAIPHAAISTTPTAVTFAAILSWRGTFFTDPFIVLATTPSVVTQGMGYPSGSPTFLALEFGSSGTNWLSSGIQMILNDPLFIAASYTTVGNRYSFLMYDFATGNVQATTGTSVQTLGASSGSNYFVGGFGSLSNNSNCYINAAMYTENKFLSVQQLLQWAAAPWDFWYPPLQGIFTVKTPTSVVAATKSAILLAGL